MKKILPRLLAALRGGESVIVGTVIEQSGSTPRSPGAKMLVGADGVLHGTIGGGEMEGHCYQEAKKLYEKGEWRLLPFTLDNTRAADAGMVCGGNLTVLLLRITPDQLDLAEALEAADRNRERSILVISLPDDGVPQLSLLTGEKGCTGAPLTAETAGAVRSRARRSRLPYQLESGSDRFYVEPQIESGTLWLIGAGHVSLATAKAAAAVDFTVRVCDDRAEFANRSRFPEAEEVRVLENFDSIFPRLGADDYVVIVTRGHAHDEEVLKQALCRSPGYIGMIGSRRKRDAAWQRLLNAGFTRSQLDTVHCPIGLPIGADTPEEIAVSIVSELIRHRAGTGT